MRLTHLARAIDVRAARARTPGRGARCGFSRKWAGRPRMAAEDGRRPTLGSSTERTCQIKPSCTCHVTIAASHRGDRRRHHRRQAPVFAVEVALSGEERPAAVDGRRLPTIGLSAFGGVVDRWWLESFIGLWSSSFFIGLLVLRGCSSPRLIAFGASSALSLVDLLDLQMRLSAV